MTVLAARSSGQVAAWERFAPLLLALLLLLASAPGLLRMPPMDRDESRFAQATAQMLESGDYVAIYFQTAPRNKKPAGIHWLQAGSVALFSSVEAREIWAYRLPSLAGGIGAVLLTLLAGRVLFDRRIAIVAGFAMACALMLQLESLTAKTDAVLLLTVLAAQLALAKAWMEGLAGRAMAWPWALLFWSALGLGILIKGPITPMVAGLTALALGLQQRRWRWLGALRPLWGLPLMLAIAVPWFVAVTWFRDTGFLGEATSKDLVAKIVGAEESHGLPPGFYLLAHLLLFWPGALFALPALAAAWKQRRLAGPLAFCLAWLLPTWLLFELVPTKLPHYVLPCYPALALLVAWALISGNEMLSRRWVSWLHHGLAGVAMVMAVGLIALPFVAGVGFLWQSLPAALLVAGGPLGALLYLRRGQRRLRALLWGGLCGVVWFAWMAGAYVPQLTPLFPSAQLAADWRRLAGEGAPPLGSTGFREPSLVFLAGTKTRLADPVPLASYQSRRRRAVVLVSDRMEAAFLAAAAAKGYEPRALGSREIINYSNGEWLTLTFYGRGN